MGRSILWKSSIVMIHILFICFQSADAQSEISKLRLKEAQQAFENADYKTVLVKLDEAESPPDSSTAKTAHLRILTQFKILEQVPCSDFAWLEIVRRSSSDYLAKYEFDTANVDIYAQVYRITQILYDYPKTIEEFSLCRLEYEKERKAVFLKEKQLKLNFINFNLAGLSLYQSIGTVALSYPDLIKREKQTTYKNNGYNTTAYYYDTTIYIVNKPRKLDFVSNRLIQYSVLLFHGSNAELGCKTDDAVNELNKLFGFEGVASRPDSARSKFLNYKWIKGNKVVSLLAVSGTYGNLVLYVYDARFIDSRIR